MNILIVDDNCELAEVISSVMSDEFESADIEVVHNGTEGLAMAIAHRPTAAILDMEMPVMSGLDSTHAMRPEVSA